MYQTASEKLSPTATTSSENSVQVAWPRCISPKTNSLPLSALIGFIVRLRSRRTSPTPRGLRDTRCRERQWLEGRLVHDLRRTAVRNLERAGVPRSVAIKLTGHKTEHVFRRYAIVAERDLVDGTAKLATLHNSVAAAGTTVLPLRGTEGTQSAAGGE
jgi:hypothetical protein